jgi:hypothetical protein
MLLCNQMDANKLQLQLQLQNIEQLLACSVMYKILTEM